MNFNISTNQPVEVKELKPWQGLLLGMVFTIIGIVILYFGISSINEHNLKKETYTEVTSKVVEYEYNSDGLQAIVVEYIVDGQTYKKISDVYTDVPLIIGTEVSLKYNPKDPKDAIFTTDGSNIIVPIAGAIFTLVGIYCIYCSFKNKNKALSPESQVVIQQSELYNNINSKTQVSNNIQDNEQSLNNSQVQQQTSTYNPQDSTADANINNQDNNINM